MLILLDVLLSLDQFNERKTMTKSVFFMLVSFAAMIFVPNGVVFGIIPAEWFSTLLIASMILTAVTAVWVLAGFKWKKKIYGN